MTAVHVPRGATLEDLSREVPGAVVHGDAGTRVRDVRHDSRAVESGDLFVVRQGRRADGRDYVRDALARGATALAASAPMEVPVPVVVVPDPESALARMSSFVWAHPTWTLDVVGITGTNGKTTTAWLTEQALTATGARPGLVGTVVHRYGGREWPALHTTPEADDLARRFAAMRDDGATHVVMEVSSIALTLKRVDAVRFRVAAFTNVTQDHLDFHGTMEAYTAAKRSLFDAHGPGASVLNVDDPIGADIARSVPGAITHSARGHAATLSVVRGGQGAHAIDALVRTPEGDVALRSRYLFGAHNVDNLLTALGILGALGIPYAAGARALEAAASAPGRLERVEGPVPVGFTVLVDYAHTPDALERVLTTLRAATEARVVCVFGCGGDRDPAKRGPMGAAVGRRADIAVVTTDNPRTEDPAAIAHAAADGLRVAGMTEVRGRLPGAREFVVEPDRRAAIALAVDLARPGDVVLIAGKGHEGYQEVHGVRAPFDDRDEARAALGRRVSGEG